MKCEKCKAKLGVVGGKWGVVGGKWGVVGGKWGVVGVIVKAPLSHYVTAPPPFVGEHQSLAMTVIQITYDSNNYHLPPITYHPKAEFGVLLFFDFFFYKFPVFFSKIVCIGLIIWVGHIPPELFKVSFQFRFGKDIAAVCIRQIVSNSNFKFSI